MVLYIVAYAESKPVNIFGLFIANLEDLIATPKETHK